MSRHLWRYPLFFLLALVLQAVVFNSISLWGYVNLYPYIVFLILLPLGWRFELQLLAAFAMGLCVDLTLASLGLHASACTLLAFARYRMVRRLQSKQRNALRDAVFPTGLGFLQSLYYILLLVAVHHAALWLISGGGGWSAIPWQLLQCVVSIGVSTLLSLLVILIFVPLSTFRR